MTVNGLDGDDYFVVSGSSDSLKGLSINGGDGDDTFSVAAGSAVTIAGGNGTDIFNFSSAGASTLGANGIVLTNIDSVNGTSGADSLTINSGAYTDDTQVVNLGSGDDTVNVGASVQGLTLNGGSGNDIFNVFAGSTVTINGGAGDNIINVIGSGDLSGLYFINNTDDGTTTLNFQGNSSTGANVTLLPSTVTSPTSGFVLDGVSVIGSDFNDTFSVDEWSTFTITGGAGTLDVVQLAASGGATATIIGESGDNTGLILTGIEQVKAATTSATGTNTFTVYGYTVDSELKVSGSAGIDTYNVSLNSGSKLKIVDNATTGTDIADIINIFGVSTYTAGTAIPDVSFALNSTTGLLTIYKGQQAASEKILEFSYGNNTSLDVVKFSSNSSTDASVSVSISNIITAKSSLTDTDRFTLTNESSTWKANKIQ